MSYLTPTICAWCGYRHDLASAVVSKGFKKKTEPRPSDGDKSLCAKCGQWNVFDDGCEGGLRKATCEEIERLDESKLGRKLVEAWRLSSQKRRLAAAIPPLLIDKRDPLASASIRWRN
jgi:hypothetical protein